MSWRGRRDQLPFKVETQTVLSSESMGLNNLIVPRGRKERLGISRKSQAAFSSFTNQNRISEDKGQKPEPLQGEVGENLLPHLAERESNGGKGLLGKYNYPTCLFPKPRARKTGPSGNPDAEQPP